MNVDVNTGKGIRVEIGSNYISNEIKPGVNVTKKIDEINTKLDDIPIQLGHQEKPIEVVIPTSGGSGPSYPTYDGPYYIQPRKVEQELSTKNKLMTNDVTVEKINYVETSNLSGGTTCIIGYE